MTSALVRTCNSCKGPFLKDGGCNRMYCSCGNSQCFICSTTVTSYEHFTPTTCPLYDDTDDRIRRELTEAQAQAMKKVLQERNDVTVDDLTVDRALVVDQSIGERAIPMEIDDEGVADFGNGWEYEEENNEVGVPMEVDYEEDLYGEQIPPAQFARPWANPPYIEEGYGRGLLGVFRPLC